MFKIYIYIYIYCEALIYLFIYFYDSFILDSLIFVLKNSLG